MTVLARLRGGHVDDLAGTTLDDDVPVLAEGRALHGEGQRGAGVGLDQLRDKIPSLARHGRSLTDSKVCWCCSSSDMVLMWV